MPDLLCSGPGPHEPSDGILGTADSEDSTALCALCGALAPRPVSRPGLDPAIEPAGDPRDLSAVRERTT